MLQDVPTLVQLLKTLQQVPYLASKNLYRVADYFLHMDEQKMRHFCATVSQLREKLSQCPRCFWWQERGAPCSFCTAPMRDQTMVCVIESWHEVLVLEKVQGYKGVYHVLGGVISPLEGVGPQDLTIAPLLQRVREHAVHEIIFATSQTPEGEATAAYIARLLRQEPVKMSCLARGLPVGSALGTMDPLTVYKALSERRPY